MLNRKWNSNGGLIAVIDNCFDNLIRFCCFCVDVSMFKYFDIISGICIVQAVVVAAIMMSKYIVIPVRLHEILMIVKVML